MHFLEIVSIYEHQERKEGREGDREVEKKKEKKRYTYRMKAEKE